MVYRAGDGGDENDKAERGCLMAAGKARAGPSTACTGVEFGVRGYWKRRFSGTRIRKYGRKNGLVLPEEPLFWTTLSRLSSTHRPSEA